MAPLRITYSLSYDWLIQGRPEGDWRPLHERGLAYEEAARAHWEPVEQAVFAAFESLGLQFWEAWPACPVHLPADVNAFKEPLTFPMTEDWDKMRSLLVHELCHLHEDHPANRARYQEALTNVRVAFPNEQESVQYHLITCTLQRAVLMVAFPDRWQSMLAPPTGHPILRRTRYLIEERVTNIDWRDPMSSLITLA